MGRYCDFSDMWFHVTMDGVGDVAVLEVEIPRYTYRERKLIMTGIAQDS